MHGPITTRFIVPLPSTAIFASIKATASKKMDAPTEPAFSPSPLIDFPTSPSLIMVTNTNGFISMPRPKDVGILAMEMYFPRRVRLSMFYQCRTHR